MTFSVNLISKQTINQIEISYYEGIDFNLINNHPKDGSKGMIIFFIHNWYKELKKWQRENKINQIINDEINNIDIDDINNNYIAIYQAENIGIEILYETIKSKIEKGNFPNQPWIPIGGIDRGGWKIAKFRTEN
jgi:hypothetical protein